MVSPPKKRSGLSVGQQAFSPFSFFSSNFPSIFLQSTTQHCSSLGSMRLFFLSLYCSLLFNFIIETITYFFLEQNSVRNTGIEQLE